MIPLGMTKARFFDKIAPSTTKGDLISRTSTGGTRVAAGTNYKALTYDSAQASGLLADWRCRLFDGPLIANGTPLASSSTDDLLNSAVCDIGASMNVQANSLRFGIAGSLAVTGTPNITFRIKWNTTTMYAFTAVTAAAGGFSLEARIVTKSTGATGVLRTCGLSGFAVARTIGIPVPTETTLDLTDVNADISVYAQWSASSASNICTCTDVWAIAENF